MFKTLYFLQFVFVTAAQEKKFDICPSEVKDPKYEGFRFKKLPIARGHGEYYGRVVKQDVCYVIFHRSVLDNFNSTEKGTDMTLISQFCNTKFRSSSPGQTSIWRRARRDEKNYIFEKWAKGKAGSGNQFRFYHAGELQGRGGRLFESQHAFFAPPLLHGKKIEPRFKLFYTVTTKFFGEAVFQYDTFSFDFYDNYPQVDSDFFRAADYERFLVNHSYVLKIPWCRDVIIDASKKRVTFADDFYTCGTPSKWEWFTCAFTPYKHCVERKQQLCGWKPDLMKCTEYSYERLQEREEPYGEECEPQDYGEPCSPCKTCDTNPWGPWGPWTASCGLVSRKRYRPPDGEPHLDCYLDESDCCEMKDKEDIPCPEEKLLWQQGGAKAETPYVYLLLVPASLALILCLAAVYMVYKSRKTKKLGESTILKSEYKAEGGKRGKTLPATSLR